MRRTPEPELKPSPARVCRALGTRCARRSSSRGRRAFRPLGPAGQPVPRSRALTGSCRGPPLGSDAAGGQGRRRGVWPTCAKHQRGDCPGAFIDRAIGNGVPHRGDARRWHDQLSAVSGRNVRPGLPCGVPPEPPVCLPSRATVLACRWSGGPGWPAGWVCRLSCGGWWRGQCRADLSVLGFDQRPAGHQPAVELDRDAVAVLGNPAPVVLRG